VEDKKEICTDIITEKDVKKQNSLDNLKPPWKEGESGNKVGRTIGSKNKKTIFQELLISRNIKETNPMTYLLNKFIDIIEEKSNNPSVVRATVVELLDRIDGKVPAKVEYSKTRAELGEAAGDLVEVFSDAEDVEVIERMTNDLTDNDLTTNDL